MHPIFTAIAVFGSVRHAFISDARQPTKGLSASFVAGKNAEQKPGWACAICIKAASGKSTATVVMLAALLGLALSSTTFSSLVQAQAGDSVLCETRQAESIDAYIKRTRGWLPQNYQTRSLTPRVGSEHLAVYHITPDAQLQRDSSIALPHEIYLDRKTCEVVGEYSPPRPAVRTSGQSDEVQQ